MGDDPSAFFSFFDGGRPARAEPAVDAFLQQHVASQAPAARTAEPASGAAVPAARTQSAAREQRPPPPPPADASADMIHPLIRSRRLDTPEDIAAWIAERKSRYPTAASVEAKAAAGTKRAHADATSSSSPLAALASYGGDSEGGAESGSEPEEAPAKKAVRQAPHRPSAMAPEEDRRRLRVCRFFARGGCSKGDRCPFAHPQAAQTAAAEEPPPARPRATLLEMLMAKDVERENYRVLQCIEYIAKHDFLGVPARRG
ncbi:hypothetical protein IWQ57_002599 [Coemansia nantahalensis]|uniref:Uncharacterized protein n=1 Tax=Coemansia nantahalensis TaxID=2789366 RepID=A0ACC1JZH2_9FUNG|nr:hypothetical protein IWQ57_002599 [Coemansia nantahalensis]